MPKNLLEQLRQYTVVVADTGDIEAMEKVRPQDATTNPSLITTAAQMPHYQPIVDGALKDARNELGESADEKESRQLRLFSALGHRLRKEDPGYRSRPRLHGSRRPPPATTPTPLSSRRTALSTNTTRRASSVSASGSRSPR